MGCGCRKGRSSDGAKNSLSRYAFLTPAQLEERKKQEEEEKKRIEADKARRGN